MSAPLKKTLAISVVIPTCGRPKLLKYCLDRLQPGFQSLGSENYEVIVSDDRTEPGIRQMMEVQYSWVRYTPGPSRGPAANRNHGASITQGEWIVFLDDDCVPEPGLLKAYRDRVQLEKECRVFEGRTSSFGVRTRIDEEAPINESGGYLWSCNFCIKKDLFFQVSGFDEMFKGPAMEDVDLRERVRALGEPIVFLKNAAVLHPWRSRRGFSFAQTIAESHRYFFEKHGCPRRIMALWYCERMIRGIIRSVLREGHLYCYRGGLRFILLEMHSFLICSIRFPK